MKARPSTREQEGAVSDSERFLFGCRLRYDYSFADHEPDIPGQRLASDVPARQAN
ncbi:hypothetical protein ACIRYZ_15205 [Kitasatospora sp. NPDC101155]|uniref:hypothetical protein n=1 Tax=Kitasatospora sp. NPDC101155 TaxID=3364097 RepID=UPI0038119BA8